jgi:hypothetical protein
LVLGPCFQNETILDIFGEVKMNLYWIFLEGANDARNGIIPD